MIIDSFSFVQMPEELDLSPYRATGISSDYIEWNDHESISPSSEINEGLIGQIENMGFSRNAGLYVNK